MHSFRPYLVIPKLIEQPTWGGEYITNLKLWQKNPLLKNKKIGQSYEIFAGSNLSLLTDSQDPNFTPELTDPKQAYTQTPSANSMPLSALIAENPMNILGTNYVKTWGPQILLLIKFTQALGNSFQLHVRDGTTTGKWKPKPESWYFFEPGIITLGIKKDTDWRKYEQVVCEIERQITAIGEEVNTGSLSYQQAKQQIQELLTQYNPWQFVNVLKTSRNQLIDLSACGIHHSWEEDPDLPLGNIVYELQVNIPDSECTIRNFDKGKIGADGNTRPLHIDDYFTYIDRSSEANDPQTHMIRAKILEKTEICTKEKLMESKYYQLDKIIFTKSGTVSEKISSFRHLFVKQGAIKVGTNGAEVSVSQGHSCFIPAACSKYEAKAEEKTEVLISY